jgi:hypothetical protein
VTLSPRLTTASTLIQVLFDLAASMGDLGGPDHVSGGVMDDRQSGGLAARIDLEAEGSDGHFRLRFLQDEGKGVATQHGGMAGGQQKPRSSWVHRIERSTVLVDDKDVRHHQLRNVSVYTGKVVLVKDSRWFGARRTGWTPPDLFNGRAVERGTGPVIPRYLFHRYRSLSRG